jgi:hypothetical protein
MKKDGGQLFTYFQLSGHKPDIIMLYASEFKENKIIYQNEIVKIEQDYRSGDVKDVYDKWVDKLNIKYYINDKGRGYISPNLNVAMKHCTGEWIKILFQDDFLYNENSLNRMYDYINSSNNLIWFATEFYHSNDGVNLYNHYFPKWVDNIWTGNNTMGCPSILTIKNEDVIYFSEDIDWLMDVEYYKRMFDKYGEPNIMNEITVINRTNLSDRDSHSFTDAHMKFELDFVHKKFDNK